MTTTEELFSLIENYLFAFSSTEEAIEVIFNNDISSFTKKEKENIEKEVNENLSNYFKKQFEENKAVELMKKYIDSQGGALSKKSIAFFDGILLNTEYELTYEDLSQLLEIKELIIYLKNSKKDKTMLIEQLREFQELEEFEKELNKPKENDDEDEEYDGDIFKIYLKEQGKYKLLTPEEERYYLKKYLEEGDEEAYNILAGSNQGLSIKVARMYQNRGLSLLDLIQEGNLGLIKAINRFDLNKKTKLSTYAIWWIRQSVTVAIRDQAKTIRIPRALAEIQEKIRRIEENYSSQYKAEPSIEELAQLIGVSEKRIREAKKYELKMVSFDKPVNEEESDASSLGDFLTTDDIETPEEISDKQTIHEVFDKMLTILGNDTKVTQAKRKEQIIRLRMGNEIFNDEIYKIIRNKKLPDKDRYTLEDLGKAFNRTRERIRQLEADGIDKLIDYTDRYQIDIFPNENYKQKVKRRLEKERKRLKEKQDEE